MPAAPNQPPVTGARTYSWGGSPVDDSPRTLAGLLLWTLALATLPLVMLAPAAVAAFCLGVLLTALVWPLAGHLDRGRRPAPTTA